MAISFVRSNTLLFIGDSITDCGRRTDSQMLGQGYVRIVRDWLLARDPANCPFIVNTGISGNKIPDLQKRWDRDVIAHKPDVVSIMIGINDVWHGLVPGREGCPIDRFTDGYHDVLTRLKVALPDSRLVLCEPSVIDPPQDPRANDLLQPYVRVVHDLAREFAAECVVPTHQAFVQARLARPDVAWTTDGVHPTPVGHMLIARTWLMAVGLL